MSPTAAHRTSNPPLVIPIFFPHHGCPHRCLYCDQHRITGTAMPTVADVDRQVQQHLEWSRRRPVEIAFYGGSFLGIPESKRRPFLEAAQRWVDSGDVRGIRCSTRPDTINAPTLKSVSPFTLSTIEIGAQSMDDTVLAASCRGHTAADTASAVKRLLEHNIRIGIQLMVGLPAESAASAAESARRVAALSPEFVRLYPTQVFPGTPLEGQMHAGEYQPLSLAAAVDRCAVMATLINKARIAIIRMGLPLPPASETQRFPIAGPQHPAFGHLVLSRIYLDAVQTALKEHASAQLHLRVHPTDRSRLTGQANANLEALSKTAPNSGGSAVTEITVIEDPTLLPGTIQIDGGPLVTAWYQPRTEETINRIPSPIGPMLV